MPCTLFFFKAKHLELFFKIYGWLSFPSSIPENVDRENQILLIPTSKISTMLYQNRDTTFLKGHSLFVCSELKVRNPTSCKTFQTLQLHNLQLLRRIRRRYRNSNFHISSCQNVFIVGYFQNT